MSHPSVEQLEAAAFGWLPEAQVRQIRAHAADCPTCGQALQQDDDVRRRLSLLREAEPRIDVSERVLARLKEAPRPGRSRRPVGYGVVVGAVLLAGVVIASNGKLRRTLRRLHATVRHIGPRILI
jgi:anti-sigma factor ChrR (cupin superfamily)